VEEIERVKKQLSKEK